MCHRGKEEVSNLLEKKFISSMSKDWKGQALGCFGWKGVQDL